MLEQRDLEAIAGIVDAKLRESEGRIFGKMDGFENRMEELQKDVEELKRRTA